MRYLVLKAILKWVETQQRLLAIAFTALSAMIDDKEFDYSIFGMPDEEQEDGNDRS